MFWHCYTVQAASKFLKPLVQLKQEPLRNFYKGTLLFICLTQTQFPTQTQGDLQQLLMAAHACELWLPAGCSCYSELTTLPYSCMVECVFPSLLWGRKEAAIVLIVFKHKCLFRKKAKMILDSHITPKCGKTIHLHRLTRVQMHSLSFIHTKEAQEPAVALFFGLEHFMYIWGSVQKIGAGVEALSSLRAPFKL